MLVDQGITVPIQEVKDKMENLELVEWLKSEYMADKDFYIGINSFTIEEIQFVNQEFNSMVLAYYNDEFRKWGIKNNGLNLLVSWGIELIRETNKADML